MKKGGLKVLVFNIIILTPPRAVEESEKEKRLRYSQYNNQREI